MMKNTIILAALTLSLCVSAFAYDWSTNPGDGSPQNPYQISEPEHLMSIGSDTSLLDKNFILTNNIIFDPDNNPAHVFTKALIAPYRVIMTSGGSVDIGEPFEGVLDGKGYTIFSLNFNYNGINGEFLGLVGKLVENGIIANLKIKDIYVNFQNETLYVYSYGGLVGTNGYLNTIGGTIINCYVSGALNGGDRIGGICGNNGGLNNWGGSIINCKTMVNVNGRTAGGLCGANHGLIKNSSSSGIVLGSHRIGGLCGWNEGTIESCISSSDVVGGSFHGQLGGLCGYNGRSPGKIFNSYSTGNCVGVSGTRDVGGFCGSNSYGEIHNCFSTGLIECVDTSASLDGFSNSSGGVFNACYFLDTAGPDNGNAIPLTEEQLKQRVNFADWDFVGESTDGNNEIWRMCVDGVGHPRLSWEFAVNGDFACGNGVDLSDFQALALNWLTEESDAPVLFNYACDANGDEIIDLEDYAVLSINWLSGI